MRRLRRKWGSGYLGDLGVDEEIDEVKIFLVLKLISIYRSYCDHKIFLPQGKHC